MNTFFEHWDAISSMEYYHLAAEQSVIKYNCPYNDKRRKEEIQSMKSFTPQKVAMIVMSNPNRQNLQLQRSVDAYVKKLNF